MDFLVPFALVLVISAITIAVLGRKLPAGESDWVVRIFLIGLILRLIFATVFALAPSTRLFHEDAGGYEHWGIAIARGWAREIPPIDTTYFGENRGYYVFSGALNYVFGYHATLPSFVNTWIGSAIGLVVYTMTRHLFHVLVARRAMLFVAFFPSNILWSSVAVKDPMMVLLVVLTLNSVIRLGEQWTFRAVMGVALPMAATVTVRFYIIYFLLFAVVASFTLFSGRVAASLGKQLALLLIGAMALGAAGQLRQAQSNTQILSFERANELRRGLATTAASGFAPDTDVSTPGRAIAFLPVGVAILLLSPFPWQMGSLRAALTLPEMIIWWLMVPLWLRGIYYALLYERKRLAPIIVFAVTLTMAYATVHGNVGVAFRQRTQITVFLYIFAALGFYLRRCQQVGLPPGILVNQRQEAVSLAAPSST